MADLDPKEIQNIKNSIENLHRTMQDFARAGIDVGSGLSNIEKKLLDMAKAAGKSQKSLEKEESALNDVEKAIDLARKSAEEREKTMEKMSRTERQRVQELVNQYGKGLVKERTILRQRVAEHKKAQDQIAKQQGALAEGAGKKTRKQTRATAGGRQTTPGMAFQRRRGVYGLGYGMRQKVAYTRAGEAPGKIAGDVQDALKGVLSPLQTAAAGKSGPLSWVQTGFGAARSAKGGREQLRGWEAARKVSLRQKEQAARATGDIPSAKKFHNAARGMSKLGGSLSLLSKALGMLGKMNWIFALVSALTGLIKAASNAEKKLTEMNRTFLNLAGPTAGMRNVPKEMEAFNSAIYDLQRNLRLGVKSKDIQEMFGAMASAGMSLQGVKQNVGDYGKAIYEARTLSLEFGTSMQDMGKMIADAMMNLRNSLDDVGKSFRAMAFDASKAGIASGKFYQIIEGATSGLAFFGNFMENASSMLRSFTKAGEIGLKDAQDAVTGIMKGFEGIDWRKGIKLLNVMGKEGMQIFQGMAQEGAAEIQELQKQIQEKTKLLVTIPEGPERKEVVGEIERLRDQLSKSNLSQDRLQGALAKAGRGDLSDLALEIGRLAERPVDVIQQLMGKFGDFGPAQLTAIEQLTGIGQKQIVLLEQTLKGTRESFTGFIQSNEELLNATFKGNEKLNDAFADLIAVSERGGDTKEIFDKLFKGMTEVEGMTAERAEGFISTLREALEGQMGPALLKLVTGLRGGQSVGEAMKGINLEKAVADAVQGGQEGRAEEQLKAEQDRMDEIISRITAGEDYVDIMKDQAEYFKAITVGDLLKQLISLVSKIWKVVSLFKKGAVEELGAGGLVEQVKGKRGEQAVLGAARGTAVNRLRDALLKRTGESFGREAVEKMMGRGGELPVQLLSKLSDKDQESLKRDVAPFFEAIKNYDKRMEANNEALGKLREQLKDRGAETLFYETKEGLGARGAGVTEDRLLNATLNKFLEAFGSKYSVGSKSGVSLSDAAQRAMAFVPEEGIDYEKHSYLRAGMPFGSMPTKEQLKDVEGSPFIGKRLENLPSLEKAGLLPSADKKEVNNKFEAKIEINGVDLGTEKDIRKAFEEALNQWSKQMKLEANKVGG